MPVLRRELLRHLAPDRPDIPLRAFGMGRVGIIIPRIAVMMDVDDGIHALLQHPGDHLVHPGHPGRIHRPVLRQMIVPADRHPDRAEARVLQRPDQLPRRLRAAPGGLVIQRILHPEAVIGVKGVAQIPPGLHLPDQAQGLVVRDLKGLRPNLRNHRFLPSGRTAGTEQDQRRQHRQRPPDSLHADPPSLPVLRPAEPAALRRTVSVSSGRRAQIRLHSM